MIHIEKGEFIAENPSLKVVTKTGDYEDTALIDFKDVNSEDELVAGAYQAQFVKYGNLVYRFNDPRELGAEILRIDPESTHSAASFVRLNAELLRQLNNGSLEPSSLDEAIATEKAATEELIEKPKPVEIEEPDPLPPLDTTTPDTTTPIDTSTTTPPVDTSTTTPPVIPDEPADNADIPTVDQPDVPAEADIAPAETSADDSTILEDVIEVISPEINDVVSSVKRNIAKLTKKTAKKIAKKPRRNA